MKSSLNSVSTCLKVLDTRRSLEPDSSLHTRLLVKLF
jgi:hypothetical protein